MQQIAGQESLRNGFTVNTLKKVYPAENRALLTLIPKEARRFLDVGCGTGALVAAIQREHGGKHFEGITYFEEEARQAQEVMNRVWLDDLNNFDFSQLGM